MSEKRKRKRESNKKRKPVADYSSYQEGDGIEEKFIIRNKNWH